jgi:GR25 family glycosyltransferase involved in LPS biosynthesis
MLKRRSKKTKKRSERSGIKKYRPKICSKFIKNIVSYVINCKSHKERLETFYKYAKKTGLRVNKEICVNGKAYTDDILLDMVNKGIVSPKADITPIEVAICLSHYNCWNRFLSSCNKYCLVLEDDAKLKINFLEKTEKIIDGLAEQNIDWGILILHPGNWMRTKSKLKNVTTIDGIQIKQETVPHNPSGTAYILTRPFAKKLVENMLPIKLPLDIYIGDNIPKFKKNIPRKMKHLSLVPQKEKNGCWKGKLLNVICGGTEGQTTQDYDAPSIKKIYKSYL